MTDLEREQKIAINMSLTYADEVIFMLHKRYNLINKENYFAGRFPFIEEILETDSAGDSESQLRELYLNGKCIAKFDVRVVPVFKEKEIRDEN